MHWLLAWAVEQIKELWNFVNDQFASINARINNIQTGGGGGGNAFIFFGSGDPNDNPDPQIATPTHNSIYFDDITGNQWKFNTAVGFWALS